MNSTDRHERTFSQAVAHSSDINGVSAAVNTVALKGINDDELETMVAWCADEGFDLTFIEVMPTWYRSSKLPFFCKIQGQSLSLLD